MPFTCEACGLRSPYPGQMRPVGRALRCPHCGRDHPFSRPPLLVVTGSTAVGKSTLCARLAGTVPGAILLDTDVVAEDMVSVAPPNHDYPAFWRSMIRIAHELAQNDVTVVYFGTMLPEQLMANADLLDYFDAIHFLCLTCPREVLRARIEGRNGPDDPRLDFWLEFNDAIIRSARRVAGAEELDATGSVDDVEGAIQAWLLSHLPEV